MVQVGVLTDIVQTLQPVPQVRHEKVEVKPKASLHASHFPDPLESQEAVAKQFDPQA